MSSELIATQLAGVRDRVAAACEAAGRPANEVAIEVAVKTRTNDECVAAARALADLGLPVLLGHNRVQEAQATNEAIRAANVPGTRVRLIGHLQSNKVNAALLVFDEMETVDSLRLAARLGTRVSGQGRVLPVLVQVNTSGEATKSGCSPAEARELAFAVAVTPGLVLRGFMTVGANSIDEDEIRTSYRLLRELRDEVVTSGKPGTEQAHELSMGMSGDLELAIAEGATVVRVGTAVFGPRP